MPERFKGSGILPHLCGLIIMMENRTGSLQLQLTAELPF